MNKNVAKARWRVYLKRHLRAKGIQVQNDAPDKLLEKLFKVAYPKKKIYPVDFWKTHKMGKGLKIEKVKE